MRTIIVAFVVVSGLLFTACGGDDGGGEGNKSTPKTTVTPVDPWKGVGVGELPRAEGALTRTLRSLAFADGMTIRYDGSGRAENICRGGMEEGSSLRGACLWTMTPTLWNRISIFMFYGP